MSTLKNGASLLVAGFFIWFITGNASATGVTQMDTSRDLYVPEIGTYPEYMRPEEPAVSRFFEDLASIEQWYIEMPERLEENVNVCEVTDIGDDGFGLDDFNTDAFTLDNLEARGWEEAARYFTVTDC